MDFHNHFSLGVAGERDWLKDRFGKEFALNIGPYPSLGIIDYAVDAQTLKEGRNL